MTNHKPLNGFSKLDKEGKLKHVADHFTSPEEFIHNLKSYWHSDAHIQKLFDEFSENTISNFYFPYGVAPNMVINGKKYIVPMVIEESSVVAAASSAAKYWSERGGIQAKIISTEKIGQVHFSWEGSTAKLKAAMPFLKEKLINGSKHITARMEKRGGGILDIVLVDMTDKIDHYYQLMATFETKDSMGANFINSCLEEFASILKDFLKNNPDFQGKEQECTVIMSILSNYTPNCLVECWVECAIPRLANKDLGTDPDTFAWKFEKAVQIAQVDPHRATTHNKGIFNGIDAVVLATGNDFRAIEACGHTYAARDGQYKSLTEVSIDGDTFKYTLRVPIALGTVGGLTSLHPLAKKSLELLGNPGAEELMMITAAAGLANNFSAIKSLVTKGIQQGHMKMHLLNILNHFNANDKEKKQAVAYFSDKKVSFQEVGDYLNSLRLVKQTH